MARGIGNPKWVKGMKTPNPKGRGAPDPEIIQARAANKDQMTRVLTQFLMLSRADLLIKLRTPGTPAIEMLTAAILLKGIANGDYSRATFLFDRAFGKVKDVVDVTDTSLHGQLIQMMQRMKEEK